MTGLHLLRHPERSEGSLSRLDGILHGVQNDKKCISAVSGSKSAVK